MRDRIYCHVVWVTRDRARLLDSGHAKFLCRFLRSVARQERAHILEIGMVSTHVHVLVRLSPVTNIPRLLQRLKGASSVLANRERHSSTGVELQWNKGYSIQSVSPRQLIPVRQYLRQQPLRHPQEAIPDWAGDVPEYEPAGGDDIQIPRSVH